MVRGSAVAWVEDADLRFVEVDLVHLDNTNGCLDRNGPQMTLCTIVAPTATRRSDSFSVAKFETRDPGGPRRQKVISIADADFLAGPWNTTSTLLPSGSSTNAA